MGYPGTSGTGSQGPPHIGAGDFYSLVLCPASYICKDLKDHLQSYLTDRRTKGVRSAWNLVGGVRGGGDQQHKAG